MVYKMYKKLTILKILNLLNFDHFKCNALVIKDQKLAFVDNINKRKKNNRKILDNLNFVRKIAIRRSPYQS